MHMPEQHDVGAPGWCAHLSYVIRKLWARSNICSSGCRLAQKAAFEHEDRAGAERCERDERDDEQHGHRPMGSTCFGGPIEQLIEGLNGSGGRNVRCEACGEGGTALGLRSRGGV